MAAIPDSLAGPRADGIGRRTARGALVVGASQIVRQLVSLGALAALARLLSPRDYGLSAMAMAVVTFVAVFSELGLSAATVQKAGLTAAQVSTLFWVNVAAGLGLTAVVAASAPLVARFYGEPAVAGLLVTLSLAFTLSGLGAQHGALLARRMQFGRSSLVEGVAFVAASGAGILGAVSGWGPYALAAQLLTERGVCTAGYWLAARWVPGLPRRATGAGGMVRMGGLYAGFNVVNYFARNLDRVLLGRLWGATATGLYSRAYVLMTVPLTFLTGPLQQVMVPALSAVRADRARFEELYLRAVGLVAAVSLPTMAGMLVAADEIVTVVMGDRWAAAVPIFRVLAVSGLVQPLVNPVGWLYLASGRTDRMFRWSLLGTPLVVAGFLAGIRWGALGVATGYAVVSVLLVAPLATAYALRTVGLRAGPLIRRVAPFAVPATLTAAALAATRTLLLLPAGLGPAARLACLVALGAALQVGYHALARDGLVRQAAAVLLRRPVEE